MDRTDQGPRTWNAGRRTRALARKEPGWKPGEIADAWGDSAAAVSPWVAAARVRGREAWRAQPRPPGPGQLTPDPRPMRPARLAPGAEAYGVRGACWTCARVATVMGAAGGVADPKARVARLVQALQWPPQRPRERAAPRDATVLKPWRVAGGPERKQRRAEQAAPAWWWTHRGVISGQGSSAQTRQADRRPSCARGLPVSLGR
jgi:transposase